MSPTHVHPDQPVATARPVGVRRTSSDTGQDIGDRKPVHGSDIAERMSRLLSVVASNASPGDLASRLVIREASEQAERVAALRSNWNAPKRHSIATPPRDGPWGEKLAILEGRMGRGVLIALVGTRGAGKTQMAVELMKAVTVQERSALFRTAMELIMRLKATYRNDSDESELAVLRAHRRPSLLVIDEIGRRGQTDWENNMGLPRNDGGREGQLDAA